MRDFKNLGMMIGGLGGITVFWGVMSILGWFQVPSLWHSAALIALGLVLIGGAMATTFLTGLAETIAERRSREPAE